MVLIHYCTGVFEYGVILLLVQYHPVFENTSAIMALFLFHTWSLWYFPPQKLSKTCFLSVFNSFFCDWLGGSIMFNAQFSQSSTPFPCHGEQIPSKTVVHCEHFFRNLAWKPLSLQPGPLARPNLSKRFSPREWSLILGGVLWKL